MKVAHNYQQSHPTDASDWSSDQLSSSSSDSESELEDENSDIESTGNSTEPYVISDDDPQSEVDDDRRIINVEQKREWKAPKWLNDYETLCFVLLGFAYRYILDNRTCVVQHYNYIQLKHSGYMNSYDKVPILCI